MRAAGSDGCGSDWDLKKQLLFNPGYEDTWGSLELNSEPCSSQSKSLIAF